MRDDRVEYLLKEWGRHIEKTVDWADCLGSNILHRAGLFSGRVQGTSGHAVLCPDSTPQVRRVDTLVRRLPDANRDAIVLWYCLPQNRDTGKSFTKRELAKLLDITEESFAGRLKRARRFLRKELTK